MTSIVLSNNRNEFDKVKQQVKELYETIKHMTDTELLLFIPDGSYEFRETYNRVILILMTDRQNTNWNNVSLDSWLFFAMLVMMDGIFWKECSILKYNTESFQIEWLMVGLCELNPYAGAYAERCCHYSNGKRVMTLWARQLNYDYISLITQKS